MPNNITTQGGAILVTQTGLNIVTNAALPPIVLPPFLGIAPELLRVRIGLQANDATRDAEIAAAFDIGLELIEAYIDRKLKLADRDMTFIHKVGHSLSLPAYPIVAIEELIGASGGFPAFHAERETGLIHLDSHTVAHEIKVKWRGGYDVLPGAIQMALLIIFDDLWVKLTSTGGAVAGGGAIKDISIDGMRVSYDTGGGGAVTGMDSESGLPSSAASLLNVFRRKYA